MDQRVFRYMSVYMYYIQDGCSCDTQIHIAFYRDEWHAPLRLRHTHTHIEHFSTLCLLSSNMRRMAAIYTIYRFVIN